MSHSISRTSELTGRIDINMILCFYKDAAEPDVKGQSLRFVKSNFKPTKNDDIQLYYAFHLKHNM